MLREDKTPEELSPSEISGLESAKKIENPEESATGEAAAKIFKEAASEAHRTGEEKRILLKIAQERYALAIENFRELKKTSPAEIISGLSNKLQNDLKGKVSDADLAMIDHLGEKFNEYKIVLQKRKKDVENSKGGRVTVSNVFEDIGAVRHGVEISPYQEKYDAPEKYLTQEGANALYQFFELGDDLIDLKEAYDRLSAEQKDEFKRIFGPVEAGWQEKGSFKITLPTQTPGILFNVYKEANKRVPKIKLLFTPDFMERSLKE